MATPEADQAAAALAACDPTDDEARSMLQYLCGYCPAGIEDAVEHVTEIRACGSARSAETAPGRGRPRSWRHGS